ncbi:class A beta-lactamase [Leifsonia sp. PS1209]|uniref:class A beta-lactamase n=1 Tax=Leifsonia sp. PS1209 TaxID=2724914 RepID=UPI001442C1CD|nr:class A beta-lactamase [Leifsonia sp. PS1209]QJA00255.1 class A beta-lactamase [Leifsonia sp. PS1209]
MNARTRIVLRAAAATVAATVLLSGCQAALAATGVGVSAAASGVHGTAGAPAASGALAASGIPGTPAAPAASTATSRAFAALERTHGATLGVTAVDTGNGRAVGYRSGERFPFASSNKTFIAAATLQRTTTADLGTVIHYTRADLLDYAPITSRFVDTGMTVRELLDAMLRFSDNTAANLLVARLGGPDAVEQWMRGIGDRVTNVDRVEPDLNEALPGDPRDTTTPAQFAADLRTVVLGKTLEAADRTLLRNTMLDNTTGDETIRAGVDPAWPVADKTGTGEYGVRDDIAVVYPAGRAPVIVVVLTRKDTPDATPDNALVAEAAKVAVRALGR